MILLTTSRLYTCSWSQELQLLEGKPQSLSEPFAEDKNLLCFPGIEHRSLDRLTNRQVTIPTELSRLVPFWVAKCLQAQEAPRCDR